MMNQMKMIALSDWIINQRIEQMIERNNQILVNLGIRIRGEVGISGDEDEVVWRTDIVGAMEGTELMGPIDDTGSMEGASVGDVISGDIDIAEASRLFSGDREGTDRGLDHHGLVQNTLTITRNAGAKAARNKRMKSAETLMMIGMFSNSISFRCIVVVEYESFCCFVI